MYEKTQKFPEAEKFGLTMQIRRSAVSVPSNIAEGYGRDASKNYVLFLKISRGSLLELETQLLISNNLGFITKSDFEKLIDMLVEISKMLNSLIKSIESKA